MRIKKAVLLLSVITFIIFVTAVTSFAAEDNIGVNLYVTNNEGVSVSDISNLNNVYATVTLSDIRSENIVVYVAVYDNEKLFMAYPYTLSSGEHTAYFSVRLPGTATQKIKAFVWNDVMEPLANVTDEFSLRDTDKTVIIENTSTIQTFGEYPLSSSWTDSAKYLSVFDVDTDTNNTMYPLENNARIILNNADLGLISEHTASFVQSFTESEIYTSSPTSLGYVYAPSIGRVTLIDTDENGYYDYIQTTSYETARVISTAYDNGTKLTTSAGIINLNEKTSCSVEIDGIAASVEDISKNDIISVVKTDASNWKIFVSRKTVTGCIDMCNTFSSDITQWEFVVNDESYYPATLSNYNETNISTLYPGQTGVFYLDIFGKIAFFKATDSSNYGFIVSAGEYASVGEIEFQVQILDDCNNVNTYRLAENIRVGNNSYAMPVYQVYNEHIASKALYRKSSIDSYWYDPVWIYKTTNNRENVEENLFKSDKTTPVTIVSELEDNYANRIIRFVTNGENEIIAITFTGSESLTLTASAQSLTYDKENEAFSNSCRVSEDTVIFNLPITDTSSRDNFEVISQENLEDSKSYTTSVFNTEEDNIAKLLVITDNEVEYEEEETPSTDMGYGFIIVAGEYTTVGDTEYHLGILDENGNKTGFKLAENVTLNNDSFKTSASSVYTTIQNMALYIDSYGKFSPVWVHKTIDNKLSVMPNLFKADKITPITEVSELADNYADRIIEFAVNSENEIVSINFADSDTLTRNNSAQSLVYDNETQKFSELYGISENTVIFNLPITDTSTKDNFGIILPENLEDSKSYTTSVFNINEYNISDLIVITDNEIIYDDTPDIEEPSTDMGYGYILNFEAKHEFMDSKYFIKVIDQNNNTKNYKLKDNLKRTYYNGHYDIVSASDIFDLCAGTLSSNDASLGMIKFSVNSNNEISEIRFIGIISRYDMDAPPSSPISSHYNKKTFSFDYPPACGVSKDAVIFYVLSGSKPFVGGIDSLVDQAYYSGSIFNIDEYYNSDLLLITDANLFNTSTQTPAVITKVMAARGDNETVYCLTFIQGGEEKTLYTTSDIYFTEQFSIGDIFEYTTDVSGKINAVSFNGYSNILRINEIPYYNLNSKLNSDNGYVFGAVCLMDNARNIAYLTDYNSDGSVTLNSNSINRHYIPENVNVTVVDCSKPNSSVNKIRIGSYSDINASLFTEDGFVDTNNDYAALCKYNNNEISEIIICKNYANKILP